MRCGTTWPDKCRAEAVWLHNGLRLCEPCARASFARHLSLRDVPRDRPYWVTGDDGLSERQEVRVDPWALEMIAEKVAAMTVAPTPAPSDQPSLFGAAS